MSEHHFTTADLVGCVQRELRMREQVYGRRVAELKMTPTKAGLEIAMMRAVLERLETHLRAERLL